MRQYGLIGEEEQTPIKSFQSLWPQIRQPRDIQRRCESLCADAPLTIIEAPMGEGKTEAALYMAERKRSIWQKRGIYVALPTQATSNQMFQRTETMLEGIQGGHVRLMHGTAFLHADDLTVQSDDAQEAERWLGSLRMGVTGRKRRWHRRPGNGWRIESPFQRIAPVGPDQQNAGD